MVAVLVALLISQYVKAANTYNKSKHSDLGALSLFLQNAQKNRQHTQAGV
jgi:hypothetical protein